MNREQRPKWTNICSEWKKKKAHNILWLFRRSIHCGADGNNIEKNYANIVCIHPQSTRSSPPTPTLTTSSYCIVTISLLLYYIHPWYEIPHQPPELRFHTRSHTPRIMMCFWLHVIQCFDVQFSCLTRVTIYCILFSYISNKDVLEDDYEGIDRSYLLFSAIQDIQLWKIDSMVFQRLSGTKCVNSRMP